MRTNTIIKSFFGAAIFSGSLLLSSVGVANAYCCKTNPAICKAICGSPCCGGGSGTITSAGGGSSAAQKEAAKKAVEEAQAVLKALEAEEQKPKREGREGSAPAPQ